MNKEDYVSIEVAKLLKEKGYPQEYNVGTLCRMQNKANPYYEKTRAITQSDIDNAFCIFNEVYPTLYEAQKWLREVHNIDVLPIIREESPKKDYCCYIYKNAKVKIKKLHKDAVIPFKKYNDDFCYDVVAVSEEEVAPNVWKHRKVNQYLKKPPK